MTQHTVPLRVLVEAQNLLNEAWRTNDLPYALRNRMALASGHLMFYVNEMLDAAQPAAITKDAADQQRLRDAISADQAREHGLPQ